jgi:hypothetical protein
MGFFEQLTSYYIKINKVAVVIVLIGCFAVGIYILFTTDFLSGLAFLFLGPLLVILFFGFLAMIIEMYRRLENINQNLMEINRALNPRSTGDSIYANTGSPRRLTEDEEAIAEEEERERVKRELGPNIY